MQKIKQNRPTPNDTNLNLDTSVESDKLTEQQMQFCNIIDGLQWPKGQSIFQHMLEVSAEDKIVEKPLSRDSDTEILNIMAIRTKEGAQDTLLENEICSYEKVIKLREKACCIFGSVARAWTHYQIHANQTKAEESFRKSQLPLPPKASEPSGKIARAEIVPDIENDDRFFTSNNFEFPANLSDIIPVQFLDVVKRYGWKEALPLMYLSRQGCHAILYEDSEETGYPFLKSSNMILDIEKFKHLSLTFDPNFRGPEWEIMTPTEEIIQVITDYVRGLSYETAEPVDFDALNRIPDQPADNAELENHLFRALGFRNCIEQMRLTSSNGFKNSYQGVTEYGELLTSMKIPFSSSVTYEDLCCGLEALNRLCDKPCYLPLSRCQMKPGEPVTQKYILLTDNICQNMSQYDWRVIGILSKKLSNGENIDRLVEKYKKNKK